MRKLRAHRRWWTIVVALLLLSVSLPEKAFAQNATNLDYTNDPAANHIGEFGANVVVFFEGGPGIWFNICRNDGQCVGDYTVRSDGKQQYGGANDLFTSGNSGQSFTATPLSGPGGSVIGSSASCTLTVYSNSNGEVRYCGITQVDRDGDNVPDTLDSCPDDGDQGYGVDEVGCPNPPPPDRDGDGVPDNSDACPDDFGTGADGCPVDIGEPDDDQDGIPNDQDACRYDPGPFNPNPAYNGCLDTDQDGIPNFADRCPNRFGPPENDGCPIETVDVGPEGSESVEEQPMQSLLPNSGSACNLTAIDGLDRLINIRNAPNLDAVRIDQFRPDEGRFFIIGTSQQADGVWYQIQYGDTVGWVRGDNIRYSGTGCGNFGLPEANGDIMTGLVTLRPAVVLPIPSTSIALAECNYLTSYVEQLSEDQQWSYLTLDDPCSAIDELRLRDFAVQDAIDLTDADVDALMATCPTIATAYAQYITDLLLVDQNRAVEAVEQLRASNDPCETASFLINQPGIATCLGDATLDRINQVIAETNRLGIDLSDSTELDCDAIRLISALGTLTQPQINFYTIVRDSCQLSQKSSLALVYRGVENNIDFDRVSAIVRDTQQCRDLNELILEFTNTGKRGEYPEQLRDCNQNSIFVDLFINLIERDEPMLTDEEITLILEDTYPCTAVRNYILYGRLPQRPEPIPEPEGQPEPESQTDQPTPQPIVIVVETPIPAPNVDPPENPENNEESEFADSPGIGIFLDGFNAASAYFSGTSPDGNSQDIYRLDNGEYISINNNSPEDELWPVVNRLGRVAYLRVNLDDSIDLIVLDEGSRQDGTGSVRPPEGMVFATESRMMWDELRQVLWVTAVDPEVEGQTPMLFEYNFDTGQMILIAENAQNPVAVGPTYLVYEQIVNDRTQLMYQRAAQTGFGNGRMVGGTIGRQDCYSPTPWNVDERLAFVCGSTVYIGNISDNEDTNEFATDIGQINNLSRVPSTYYLTFDDDQVVYALDTDTGEVVPYIQVGTVTVMLTWLD